MNGNIAQEVSVQRSFSNDSSDQNQEIRWTGKKKMQRPQKEWFDDQQTDERSGTNGMS